MLKVYPVLADCISRYQRPAKYTRAYIALCIMIVINICMLMVARVNANKEDVAMRIFRGPGIDSQNENLFLFLIFFFSKRILTDLPPFS